MAKSPAALIAQKRDGGAHLPSDLHHLIASFQDGTLADYQMTAWLMAVYLNGLDDTEMIALTEAMLYSGQVQTAPAGSAPRVDKHSTGGVGDKISLPLAPLAACCGLDVPMIAGRGLGHTGGTLDKLESISGYNTRLSAAQFKRTVKTIGASIIGQTKDIAPADRRIYALRDVTGTVACRPLIVASILSKKLAEGLDGLVLDVKVGRGAFMKTQKAARQLAKSLTQVSAGLGTPATARLTNMDAPLGRTIGNALEIKESIEILQGEGPTDTTELTLTLCEEMLLIGKVVSHRSEARRRAKRALSSGEAFERFVKMVELQGGDPRQVEAPQRLPKTKLQIPVHAAKRGTISAIDSLDLAEIALEMGAGRKRQDDVIDHAVGIEVHARIGDRVQKGDELATLHLRRKDEGLVRQARQAFSLSPRRVDRPPLLLSRAIRAR